jgi:hypothetical protein
MLVRLAKIVAINLGAILLVAILAELIFGNWFSRDPLDRINIQRGVSLRVDPTPLYSGAQPFVYRRDRWGFRGPGVEPAKVDVLSVGGSTTNQLYLPEEDTWQAVMMRRAAERGRPLVVANAGLDGQTTVGLLYAFETWFGNVPGLKPRFVLAYLGVNDALLGGSTTDTLAFSSVYRWIHYNSALYRLGKTFEGAVLARNERLTHSRVDFARAQWTDKPNFPDNRSARPQSDPAAYADRLREIIARIRAMGSEPVFVTQSRGDYRVEGGKLVGVAAEQGLNGVDQGRLLGEFNRTTLSVCIEAKIACLDLAGEVAFGDGDFYDVVHNTPQGAAKIGAWLGDRMADLVKRKAD